MKRKEINTQWINMTKEFSISSRAKVAWFGKKNSISQQAKQTNIYKNETAGKNTLFESISSY